MDMCLVVLTGRLTRDPQFFGEGDKRRAVFSVAVNRGKAEARKSTFIDCIVWGRLATAVEGLSKGSGVSLTGEFETDSYEKDGEKVSRSQVNVRTLAALAASTRKRESEGNTADGRAEQVTIPF